MKIIAVFRKSILEQVRDYWVLIMTIILAPCFVILYWLMMGGGSTSYNVVIINNDKGIVNSYNCGSQLIDAFKEVKYDNGNPILNLSLSENQDDAETKIKNRNVAALIIIPADFTEKVTKMSAGDSAKPSVQLTGDISNPQYSVAAIMSNIGIEAYIQAVTKKERPYIIKEVLLGQGLTRSEFESYVPGLIIFSVIMLIFTVAMSVVREIESGTIKRLQITNVTAFDYLAGMSITQFIIGILSVALTIVTAMGFGFRIEGSLGASMLILGLTVISIIGIGLIVASFSKSSTFVLTVGTFPLFILMFFSGAIYPLPRTELFEIGGRMIAVNDILPPTYATIALNKVLSLGGSMKDVTFELTGLAILSTIYFVLGIVLFKKFKFRFA